MNETVVHENNKLVENPTVFHIDKILTSIFKKLIGFEIFGKLLIFLSCFPPWGTDKVSDQQKSLFSLGAIIFVSIINVYYLTYFGYRKDEMPMKRRFCDAMFFHPAFCLALINIILKIILAEHFWKHSFSLQLFDPIARFLGLDSFHHPRAIFVLLLICTDLQFITIGMCYTIKKYEPLKYNCQYRKMGENRQNAGSLSILDSRSFNIIVKNIGESEVLNSELKISRRITRATKGCCGLFKEATTVLNFVVKISRIKAGRAVTIIPTSHEMEGAVRVHQYRAFGYDVGLRVVTKIKDKNREGTAKLEEEYAKKDGSEERVEEEGPVCPKWSRTAQNPNYMRTLM